MFEKIKSLYRFFSSKYLTVHLDYPFVAQPRYGHGKPLHSMLQQLISSYDNHYISLLQTFSEHENAYNAFLTDKSDSDLPAWNNGFLPGLDMVSLYGMVRRFSPANYIEVGSGNSTKVVRKAIKDGSLHTKIISIDPFPRASIDHLSDTVIRSSLESLKDMQFIIHTLNENDVLFIDNSHRSFANTDVTVFFLELLPYLKKGVIVHVHDVYLPHDYPQFMCDRYYNEQYLLASFLMANPQKYIPVFPCYYISCEQKFKAATQKIWDKINYKDIEHHGGSFWFRIE